MLPGLPTHPRLSLIPPLVCAQAVRYQVTVSYLEVYGETMRDLLADDTGVVGSRGGSGGLAGETQLAVQEGGPGGQGVHVAGLREVPVACGGYHLRELQVVRAFAGYIIPSDVFEEMFPKHSERLSF